MPKYRLAVQRFPYGSVEHTPCVTWLMEFAQNVTKDPRFEVIFLPPLDDTPITMTRNRSVQIARKHRADLLLMIDSDMDPDCELGRDIHAKEFWPTTIEFMLNHPGPCVVAAPYCGPPPMENIYVFNWQNMETGIPDKDLGGMKLGQFTREHAYQLGGIQEVAALATGLIVFDMRAFDNIETPYFSYEFDGDGPRCQGCGQPKRGPEANKCSTEDVVTTRDLSIAGVPQYCNWDAWAGHRKMKTVRKPQPFTADGVAAKMHDAVINRRRSDVRLIDIKTPEKWRGDVAEANARFDAEKAAAASAAREAGKPRITEAVGSFDRLASPPTETEVAEMAGKLWGIPEQYEGIFHEDTPKAMTTADLLR